MYDIATDEKLDVVPVEQGEEADGAGMKLTFERELRYTGIIARQDPGAAWMWVGSTLLVLGMCMTFMARHRRVWVRVTPTATDRWCRSRRLRSSTPPSNATSAPSSSGSTRPPRLRRTRRPQPVRDPRDKELIDA
nr:cytochrome c biogenesis protein ResB [Tessaracoccus coleopterorum]